MNIRFVLHALHPSGYREFALYFISALKAAGHNVTTTDIQGNYGPGVTVWDLKSLVNQPEVNVIVSTPDLFSRHLLPGARNVGFTMFEATRIPSKWVPECNQLDAILVPSAYCRDAFVDSGVTVPVHIVHPGVDFSKIPLIEPSPSEDFRFLSVFQWSDRKDPESLLTAYWQEFSASERVVLTLKTYGFEGILDVDDRLRAIQESLQLPEYARLEVIQKKLTTDEMWRLHASSDCYVSIHHGEGWGMSLVDAMALGKPCIATAYSGNLEYQTTENSYLVPYSLGTARVQEPEFLRDYYKFPMEWASIDVGALRERMRYVFEHRDEAQRVGAVARECILGFNPSRSAKMFEKAILSGVLGEHHEDDRLADS
jgi:glycosyltransferase involved in cell wall biosynthesis